MFDYLSDVTHFYDCHSDRTAASASPSADVRQQRCAQGALCVGDIHARHGQV